MRKRLLVLLALGLTACNVETIEKEKVVLVLLESNPVVSDAPSPTPSPEPSPVPSSEPTPLPSTEPSPSPSPSPEPIPVVPPLTFDFSVTGSGSYTTPSIETDNVLRVRIRSAGAGPISIPGYSNFTANYGCIEYSVTVNGRTVNTQMLSVDGGNWICAGAPSEQVIDFSDRLGQGHNSLNITVSSVRYDFYCQLYWAGWVYGSSSMYCPLRTLYQAHTARGSLDVQINGTGL